MNTDTKPRRLLGWLVILLLAVVGYQSYSLYRVHDRLDKLAAESHGDSLPAVSQRGATNPPNTESKLPTNDLDHWFGGGWAAPFDPNSWNPMEEMDRMRKHMDQVFDEAFGRFRSSPRFGDLFQGWSFNPSFDMTEDSGQYIIRMDIPGANKNNIDVKLEDRTLSISGKRQEQVDRAEPGKIVRQERRLGQFERVITLPGPIEKGSMQAKYENGVLTITVKKAPRPGGADVIPIQ